MAEARSILVLFIVSSTIAAIVVLAKDEPVENKGDDPKKAMENLGNFFKMMSGGQNGSCEFTCPEGLVPLPRPGHIPSSNGCGSLGIKLDTSMFPGFEQCCAIHDKCYDKCNTKRDTCDLDFKDCLEGVCKKAKLTASQERGVLCDNAGGVMQAAATGLGCSAFNNAQKKACVCTSGNAIGKDDEEEDEDDEEEEDDEDSVMGEQDEIENDYMHKVEL